MEKPKEGTEKKDVNWAGIMEMVQDRKSYREECKLVEPYIFAEDCDMYFL